MRRASVSGRVLSGILCLFAAMAVEPGSRAGDIDASLAAGLVGTYRLDGGLDGVSPEGVRRDLPFARNSPACLPDREPVPLQAPRYLPGRFGRGLFIESGSSSSASAGGVNLLPHALAVLTQAREALEPIGDIRLAAGGAPGQYSILSMKGSADGGAQTPLLTVPAPGRFLFSCYARSRAGIPLRLELLSRKPVEAPPVSGGFDKKAELTDDLPDDLPEEPDAPTRNAPADNAALGPVGSGTFPLAENWTRLEIPFSIARLGPVAEKSASVPLRIRAMLAAAGTVELHSPMLESLDGYAGRSSAATWLEPGLTRPGERVIVPRVPGARNGTIAFWFRCEGTMQWRRLISFGDGWNAALLVDIKNESRLVVEAGKETASLPFGTPAQWHHLAIAWDTAAATVFMDGTEQVSVPYPADSLQRQPVHLGGDGTDMTPALRANAVIDEIGIWRRILPGDDVAALFRRTAPLGDLVSPELVVDAWSPMGAFSRDAMMRIWTVHVENRGSAPIDAFTIRYGIRDIMALAAECPALAPGGAHTLNLPWSPARLMAGPYVMTFSFEGGRGPILEYPIDITPARVHPDNLHIISWNGAGQPYAELGVTVGGVPMGMNGCPRNDLDAALKASQYVQSQIRMCGLSTDPGDRFVTVTGETGPVDQRAPAAQADVDAQLAHLCTMLQALPDIRLSILNTENQWIQFPDFRPATRQWAAQQFGLDLTPWMVRAAGNADASINPFGRLRTADGRYPFPPRGRLPADDGLYRFMRWWHDGSAGTEVFLNTRIAERLRQDAPWITPIMEPVLRRPPIRAYRTEALLSEWYYYPDPRAAIRVQEELAAAARGTRATISAMPQFLLKPGMAAPYAGLPTPDLFRETVWHCLSRPLRHLEYWNLDALVNPARGSSTQQELDARFGTAPAWNAVLQAMTRSGDKEAVFLHIPELKTEVARLHREVVHPLGALFPAWQNAPRRIAVYRSFAGQLFLDARWPSPALLEQALDTLPHPYDILYDEDFFSSPVCLRQYDVLLLPNCPVLPDAAWDAVDQMIRRGGVVMADSACRADIPGIVRILPNAAPAPDAAADREKALVRRYGDAHHPQVVEALQEGTLAAAPATLQDVRQRIEKACRPAVTCLAPEMAYNLLCAEGITYLAVVNTRRTAGPHYGHFGKVLESGVAQRVGLRLAPSFAPICYDLLSQRRIKTQGGDVALDLPGAGGAILAFLPAPIDGISLLRIPSDSAALIRFEAVLHLADQAPATGVIPLDAQIVYPDGSRSDRSCHSAFRKGLWRIDIPRELNAPEGTNTLTVRERASGKSATIAWSWADQDAPPIQARNP